MLELPPDYTFLVQFVTFGVLVFVLSKLLFAPFLEVLAERDARTIGDVEQAAATRAEVEALSSRVDAELSKARAAANAEVEAVRARTREEASQLFQSAQHDASARLSELRSEVATATREARGALAGDSRTLADAMVAAVIGGGATR
jgi:F-type H+-transporting ATPase subunit b